MQRGVKFCSNCGEKLATAKIECYSCKTLVDDNVKFCPNCGTSYAEKNMFKLPCGELAWNKVLL